MVPMRTVPSLPPAQGRRNGGVACRTRGREVWQNGQQALGLSPIARGVVGRPRCVERRQPPSRTPSRCPCWGHKGPLTPREMELSTRRPPPPLYSPPPSHCQPRAGGTTAWFGAGTAAPETGPGFAVYKPTAAFPFWETTRERVVTRGQPPTAARPAPPHNASTHGAR